MDNVSPQTAASPTGPASSTSTISAQGHKSVPVASSSTAYTGATRCKKQTRHVRRNAFILFSKNERAIVSKYLGKKWNALSHAEKQPGVLESKRLGNLYEEQYVDFNYCPKKNNCKAKTKGSRAKNRHYCRKAVQNTDLVETTLYSNDMYMDPPPPPPPSSVPHHNYDNDITPSAMSIIDNLPTEDSSDLDDVAQEDLYH